MSEGSASGRRPPARLRCLTVLFAGLFFTAVERSHTQEVPAPANSGYVLRTHVDLVQEDIEVLDKRTGRPLDGLRKEDFLVEEDGSRQRMAGVSRDQVPLSVVLLVDQTDTVRPVLAQLAAGALQALGHLKAIDEVAVMAYSSSTELLQSFTLDRALVTGALDRASRGKSSAPAYYNEAIYQASSLLQNAAHPENRRVVIWLTDNVPNFPDKNVHTEDQALVQAFSAFTVITGLIERSGLSNVIAIANKNPLATALHHKNPAGDVYRYAGKTGGEVTRANGEHVSTRLAEAIDALRARYTVSFYPAATAASRRFHHVTVSVQEGGRKRNDLTVRGPLGYYR